MTHAVECGAADGNVSLIWSCEHATRMSMKTRQHDVNVDFDTQWFPVQRSGLVCVKFRI